MQGMTITKTMRINDISTKARRRFSAYQWRLQVGLNKDKLSRFNLGDGVIIDYPLNSAIGKSLFAKSFERAEIRFVKSQLESGDIFLDIGANGGIFTLIAANIVGSSGHVYAFEPAKRELDLLTHNVKLNNFTNVTILNYAVSNNTGVSQFAISTDGAMNSLAETQHVNQHITDWVEVNTITVDDVIAEIGIQQVDFIKIDVEGAERLVLQGATNLLNKTDAIAILFESGDMNSVGFEYSTQEFLTELIENGNQLYYLDSEGNPIRIDTYDDSYGREIYNFILMNRN